MKKAISLFLALGFVLGIAGPVMGENRLVAAAGITEGAADSRYVNKATDDMTGALTVTEAGLPLTVTNTTDAAENIVFTLYTNRGTGVDDDKAVIDIFFDDDASAKTLPGSFFFQAEDLVAKGGSTGGFGWRSGSISPVTNFFCSGAENNLQANFFSLLLDSDTGMRGGVDLLQWAIANITHMALVGGGTDELQLLAGYNFTAVGSGSFGDKLAVGLSIGSIDASVRFQVGGTTLGSLPAPLVTTAQRVAIASGTPADGVQADDSDLNALFRYSGAKAAWERFAMDVPTIKSGTVAGASFAGNPKTFTVTFGTAFPDTNYSVSVINEEGRTWTFQSKLAGSFVMNSNANLALTLNVDWTAIAHNDP